MSVVFRHVIESRPIIYKKFGMVNTFSMADNQTIVSYFVVTLLKVSFGAVL